MYLCVNKKKIYLTLFFVCVHNIKLTVFLMEEIDYRNKTILAPMVRTVCYILF